MMFRPSHVVVGALVLTAAACSDSDNVVHTLNAATVRLVNDTDTPLSLINAGIIDPVNTALVFGQASACVLVDLTNTPTLTITNVAGATIAFTPILSAGDNVTVVAFAATVGNVAAVGNVQFATLNNHFVPALNGAGLRFFNGVSTTGPLVMRRNGLVLTPFVGFGGASRFVSVPIDSASITFSNQNSFVLDAGRMAFPLGQNSTVVVGPPAPETVPLRFFTVQGC
jgi:hypothetical protein